MKTNKYIKQLLWILVFVITTSASAQKDPFIDSFSIIEKNGKVYLFWVITEGNSCNGISILRSTDNKNFNEIGNIAGVCGSSSAPQPYEYIDDSPVMNSVNYYRLEFGGNGASEILSLEIINITGGGYQVRPNPVRSDAKIYFNNDRKGDYQLNLYNIGGVPVHTDFTEADHFNISGSKLSPGVYVFTITEKGKKPAIQGRLVIQH